MIKRVYRYQPATDTESVVAIFELLADGTVRAEYPDAARTGFDRSIEAGLVHVRTDGGRRMLSPRDGKAFLDALEGAFRASSMMRIETVA